MVRMTADLIAHVSITNTDFYMLPNQTQTEATDEYII